MLRRLFCLFIVLFLLQTATGQVVHRALDELLSAVQRTYDTNSDSLEYYATKATELAKKQGNTDAEIKAQRLLAIKYYLNGQSDKAVKLLLDVARRAEQHPVSLESASLDYAIAQVYDQNKYSAICKQYLRNGLGIALKFNDDELLADGYNRLGVMFERKEMYDSALYFYKQSLHYNDKGKAKLGKAYSLENIAGIYAKRNQPAKALVFQKEALMYKMQEGKQIDLALAYINIAETYDSLKQFDSTISYIQKTLAISTAIDFKDLTKYTYQFLSDIYERHGNYGLALGYHKKYTALNDSIYNDTKAKQLAELNTKYETEKKEEQIKGLNQQTTIQKLQLKQRNIVLFVIIALFLAAGAIAYLAYNRRKLKEQTARQLEINRQQSVIAREVFNAEENERKRIAADLHDGVGQLLSAALLNLNGYFKKKNIDKQTDVQAGQIVSLVTESYDELRSISHQMMPNALQKTGLSAAVRELISKIGSDTLAANLEITGFDGRINPEVETVVYRVIQECIANVLKHSGATRIDIQILNDEDGISATIEDNGKGFDAGSRHEGIGLKNMQTRVRFQNGTLDINSHPGKGTLVAIHIPV